jgi:hypothetical protein
MKPGSLRCGITIAPAYRHALHAGHEIVTPLPLHRQAAFDVACKCLKLAATKSQLTIFQKAARYSARALR